MITTSYIPPVSRVAERGTFNSYFNHSCESLFPYPMFRFRLEVATALAISALCSLVILYFTGRSTEGVIHLPVHVEEGDTLHDPFDVTRPEDVLHGYPINADGFWESVCVTITRSTDYSNLIADATEEVIDFVLPCFGYCYLIISAGLVYCR